RRCLAKFSSIARQRRAADGGHRGGGCRVRQTGYLGVIRKLDRRPAPALFVIGACGSDCLTGLSGCCSTGGAPASDIYPADLEATAAIVDLRCVRMRLPSGCGNGAQLSRVRRPRCGAAGHHGAAPGSSAGGLRAHRLRPWRAIPANGRGEKLRSVLRDRFLSDPLDPVYVAYKPVMLWCA
uniref:RNA methyltransferase n=1 Tax=Macrostomum lignano TaxID=282301 RepID=A0A1I8FL62_9PLAT